MNSLLNYKIMSNGLEMLTYVAFGLIMAFFNILPFFGIVYAFMGSITIELVFKFLAAASGSASGAKLLKTISTSDFWVKTGIGFACSASLSTTAHELFFPKWNVYAVFYVMGVFGPIILRIIARLLNRVESRTPEIADAVLEKGNKFIKLKEKPEKKEKEDGV